MNDDVLLAMPSAEDLLNVGKTAVGAVRKGPKTQSTLSRLKTLSYARHTIKSHEITPLDINVTRPQCYIIRSSLCVEYNLRDLSILN